MRKLIFIIIIVAAVIGITFAFQPRQVNGPLQDSGNLETASEEVVIQDDYVRYPGEEGRTAFDLLQQHVAVEFEQYDFGVFVKSINGIAPPENHFWKFLVNGQDAQVGADQLQTKNGDVIEWVIEEIR